MDTERRAPGRVRLKGLLYMGVTWINLLMPSATSDSAATRSAWHRRTAVATSVSRTGWRSKAERLITLSTSLVGDGHTDLDCPADLKRKRTLVGQTGKNKGRTRSLKHNGLQRELAIAIGYEWPLDRPLPC